jgi:ABC-type lipoprotein export system ATPase subunit
MTPAVLATDLFRVYATREGRAAALQGLTLEVAQGEIVVVFGPSGSGKTTLLQILAGLDAPSAGRVRVLGVDLRSLRGRRREGFRAATIGFADQHYSRLLPPELSVAEAVELPLALGGEGGRSRRARVRELLDRVGLADHARARSKELSGGEQQRVALCAAVAHRPKLLLADEPTGELDAISATAIYQLIGELVREERGTAVIVSHDPGSTAIADRVVQVRDGRISAETRRGGQESIVVGETGWLRVPDELLARSQIRTRARPALVESGLNLTSADEHPAPEPEVTPAAPAARARPAVDGAAAELRAVERRFSDEDRPAALENVTARFAAHRLTAISGPSGSGKTTLLHLLAGLDLPTRGDVIVLGNRISDLDRASRAALRRNRIALVAQDPPLVPFLTAMENVALALNVRNGPRSDVSERSGEALEAVGLGGLLEQRVDRLSMGERQRVAIARAVAAKPELLLADEPTARLDQANAAAFAELLAHLVERLELTVIFSTHDALLLNVAEDVIELNSKPVRREEGAE